MAAAAPIITRLHCESKEDAALLAAYVGKAQAQLDAIRRSGDVDPWRQIHPWTIGTDCSMPYIHYVAHSAGGDIYGWMSVLVHARKGEDKYAFIAEVAATVRGLGHRMHEQLVAETKDTLDFLYLYAVNDAVADVYASRWGYERIGDTRHMIRVFGGKRPSAAFLAKCMDNAESPLEDVAALLAPLHTTQNRRFMHLVRGLPGAAAGANAANLKGLAENVEIATSASETEEEQRAAAAGLLEEFYVRRGVPVPAPRTPQPPRRLTYGPGWTQTEKGRRRMRRRGGRKTLRRRR